VLWLLHRQLLDALKRGETFGQKAVNEFPASLQTKEREAVVMPLPVSMHTGQIIMLTKMLTSSDLRFYSFENGAPVETWHSTKNAEV